jgi:hypothetical protein
MACSWRESLREVGSLMGFIEDAGDAVCQPS